MSKGRGTHNAGRGLRGRNYPSRRDLEVLVQGWRDSSVNNNTTTTT